MTDDTTNRDIDADIGRLNAAINSSGLLADGDLAEYHPLAVKALAKTLAAHTEAKQAELAERLGGVQCDYCSGYWPMDKVRGTFDSTGKKVGAVCDDCAELARLSDRTGQEGGES